MCKKKVVSLWNWYYLGTIFDVVYLPVRVQYSRKMTFVKVRLDGKQKLSKLIQKSLCVKLENYPIQIIMLGKI